MIAALPASGTPAGSLQPDDADAVSVMSYMFWLEFGVDSSSVPVMLQPLNVPVTEPPDAIVNDAFVVAHAPVTLSCVTLSAFSALYVHVKFDAVPPRLIVPDNVCFALYAPEPESIFVTTPVMPAKLKPELSDHVAPLTVRDVKSLDITNELSRFSVLTLLFGSISAMVE